MSANEAPAKERKRLQDNGFLIIHKKDYAGNAAAMREALVAVKKSIDSIGASSLDCDPEILMASLTQVCAKLSARIERALSKPPRNCDIYDSYGDAIRAFEDAENAEYYEDAAEWLYAPANEEGATDGE
jgi:hypothetical protein